MSVDRGFTWMDDETIALIDIWGKDDVQLELNGSKRNFAVYERIAHELAQVGFSRTAYQCREKIKRLRKEYQIAKYCVQHNISQKKPMKHYELVDLVLSRELSFQNAVDVMQPSSDQEDELHFAFNPQEQESDCSNSGGAGTDSQLVLPGPSCSISSNGGLKMKVKVNSGMLSPSLQNDSNDTLIANGEDEVDVLEKECSFDDSEPPWVPNVVLVEKDNDESIGLGDVIVSNEGVSEEQNATSTNHQLQGRSDSPTSAAGDEEPPLKRRKLPEKHVWFKKMLDKVTDRFVKYQEQADVRFLERVMCLEQERIKRDEEMQRLWMEFEERRRKEEQQHELKMMMLFGQFVSQVINSNQSKSD